MLPVPALRNSRNHFDHVHLVVNRIHATPPVKGKPDRGRAFLLRE
jgi:hypothetical protein